LVSPVIAEPKQGYAAVIGWVFLLLAAQPQPFVPVAGGAGLLLRR